MSVIYQFIEAECEVEKDIVIVFQGQSHTGKSIHIANQLYDCGQGVKHPNVIFKHRDSVKIKYKSSFSPSNSYHAMTMEIKTTIIPAIHSTYRGSIYFCIKSKKTTLLCYLYYNMYLIRHVL